MIPYRSLSLIGLLASLVSAHGGAYPGRNLAQSFSYPDGTTDLGDGSILGSERTPAGGGPVAMIMGSRLVLSERNSPHTVASFKLPDLDPANVIRSLDVSFGVFMDKDPGAPAGEGWSLNFGRIPADNGTGENGFSPLPGGLTLAFDTGAEAGDPSSIEVFVGGVTVGNYSLTFAHGFVLRSVLFHWDQTGLDLTYDGKVVFADLPTPGFNPGPGDVLAFTARTTVAGMDTVIDNLKVATVGLPVIQVGGPVISEFVADNPDFEDEFADKPGWIELFNGSASSIDLTGWYLTDARGKLTKWRIPALILSPYNYQVVYASGRDLPLTATSFMHAGFSLARSGGYVALARPDGQTIASEIEYGPQQKGVSYGEQGAERKRGYMFPATPGTVNTQTPADNGFSPDVVFSKDSVFFSEAFPLSLSAKGPAGTVVRFTVDRTEPGPTSPAYVSPISITRLTKVRARAFSPGHLPGRISSRTFVMMDSTLSDYNGSGKVFDSNVPLVFLDSFGLNVDGSTGGSRPFRLSHAIVIPPDPKTGRASLTSPAEYAGPAGVHVRGESSAGFDQRSYSLELWDETARDFDAGLLGMPPDSDWVLYGPWSEKSLMRNKLVFEWMRALRGEDGTAVRTRFIELFFNQTNPANGRVGYASYRGIYLLMEKPKRGGDRLPLENLNDKTVDPALITGGYIFRKDKDDALKNNWTTSRFSIPLQSFDPDRLNAVQLTYLRGYINSFEAALSGGGFRDFRTGYRAFLDPDTFIDAQWMLEIAKQVDGYVFSTYFHKDRSGRLRAGPLWDFNISLGNADYASGDRATGWLYDVANGVGQLWYPRLHADPDYKLQHWDRYWEMRTSILSDDAVQRSIDGHMAILLDGYTGGVSNRVPASIQNPVARHIRRWPRLGIRDWPNPPAETKIRTWQEEVAYMRDWLKARLLWLDDQSARIGAVVYRPPTLSRGGGNLPGPFHLSVEPFKSESSAVKYGVGDIYYTTDNSDPRLPGGEIANGAVKYAGPLAVESSLTVKARLYFQRQWSPLATATYLLDAIPARSNNLVVSEIFYRPTPPSVAEAAAGLVEAGQFEYVELRNIARKTTDLSGVRFVNGVDFDFTSAPASSRFLNPGESAVIVADPRAFAIRYPQAAAARVLGRFRGRLDNGGETIRLTADDGDVIKEFRFDQSAPWPSTGELGGISLVLLNPAGDPDPSKPSNWIPSIKVGGTPGVSGVGAGIFLGDPKADTDADGVGDLFEFAAGSDPENPASRFPVKPTMSPWSVNGVTDDYLLFELRRATGLQGIKTTVWVSRDLVSWKTASPDLELAATRSSADGSVTEIYRTARPVLKSGSSALFVRVLVSVE